MNELKTMRTPEVAERLGIKRRSVKEAVARFDIHPLYCDGNKGYVWDAEQIEELSKVYYVKKVANTINPEWKKPLFKSKARRPTLTKEEHDLAVSKARINQLRARIDAKNAKKARHES